jgi:hypothetical protein
MNPAATIGVLAVGAIIAAEPVGYIVSQIVVGVAGALLLRIVLGGLATGLGTPELTHGVVLGGTTVTITPAIGFMVEAVLAFFLVTVVLSAGVAGRAAHLGAVAIGLTLVLNIDMGGAPAGAAFNPARTLGPLIVTGNLSDAWLYVLAPSSAPSSRPSSIWAFLYSPTSGLRRLRHRPSESWMLAERSTQRRAAHIHAAFMLVDAVPSRGLTRRPPRLWAGHPSAGDWLVPSVL